MLLLWINKTAFYTRKYKQSSCTTLQLQRPFIQIPELYRLQHVLCLYPRVISNELKVETDILIKNEKQNLLAQTFLLIVTSLQQIVKHKI